MAGSKEKGEKDKRNGPHHYSAEEEDYGRDDGKGKGPEEALLSETQGPDKTIEQNKNDIYN